MSHANIAYDKNHRPYAWTYADEATRTAATGFVAIDKGKLALQSDNVSLWVLTSHDPISWTEFALGLTFVGLKEAASVEETTPNSVVNGTETVVTLVYDVPDDADYIISWAFNIEDGDGNTSSSTPDVMVYHGLTEIGRHDEVLFGLEEQERAGFKKLSLVAGNNTFTIDVNVSSATNFTMVNYAQMWLMGPL